MPTCTRCASALLRDGHSERADGRRRGDQHVLRHERGGREEPQGGGARRSNAPARLRHRLRREPAGRRVRGAAAERHRRREAQRGDRRVRRRRRRRDRLRPGRRADRPRARVREDPGRLLVLVQLLRDPARARRVAQPQRRRGARRDPPPRRPGSPRGRAHRDQPRLLPRPRRGLRPAAARPRGGGDARASSACGSARSRSTTSTTRSSPRCARRRRSSKHLHVPLQSGDDGVLRAMRRRYTTDTYLRRLAPLADEFNITSDVIVGFPAEDDAAFETTLRTVERAGITKVHVFPYSPRPGHGHRGRRSRPAAGEEGARRPPARSCRTSSACAAGAASRSTTSCSSTGPGRGYGDDYSPWLVDAPVGELVRVRAAGRHGGGDPCRSSVTTASSASIAREGAYVAQGRRDSSRSTTSTRRRRCTFSSSRSATSTPSARSGSSMRENPSGCSNSSPRPREKVGLTDYRVLVNVGPTRGPDGLPPALAHPRRRRDAGRGRSGPSRRRRHEL